MYFSKNINELLASKRMRVADLAREINLTPQQVGRYVSGASQPKMEGLVQLGQLFDVAIDDLILVDLSKSTGRRYGQGAADNVSDTEEQTIELNKLLRLRIAELERNLKASDPDLAKDLGIE
jgi:transcriptional regulator with XRE-family HTH domain